jgi:hypothetical protein
VTVRVAVGGIVEVRIKVSNIVVVVVVVMVDVLKAQGVKTQEPHIGQRIMRGTTAMRIYRDIVADIVFSLMWKDRILQPNPLS